MFSPSDVPDLALALSVEGIGSASLSRLAAHLGDRDFFDLQPGDLVGLDLKDGLLAKLAELLASPGRAESLRRDLAQALGAGGQILDLRGASLPGLADLSAPPLFLACNALFEASCFSRPRVAVVGTRGCSQAGRALARELGQQLAARGVLVISGGADGIDSAAHRGALEAGGQTAVILGGALSLECRRDPRRFDWQWRETMVLSEQLFAVPIRAYMYPRRNRLIAALAQVVVVVEGDRRSGSMITADWARKLGRPLVAVPGHPHEDRSQGPLGLLAQGATLYRGVDDVTRLLQEGCGQDLGGKKNAGVAADVASSRARKPVVKLSADERLLVEILDQHGGSLDSDQLAHEAGFSTSQLATLLLSLELKGRCQRQAGQRVGLI